MQEINVTSQKATENAERPSALDFTEKQWRDWFVSKGQKPFVAKQIRQWIFSRHSLNPQEFSNVSLPLRNALSEEFDWTLPEPDTLLQSADRSEKVLLKLKDGRFAECVIMPSENRTTLCVSSQVGCRMACSFCQTGKMGLMRNLSSGEILAQLVFANMRLLARGENKVTNIVFMGMGEPLDNYDNVVEACRTMLDPDMFGLSKHKVTVSTSGLVPEILKLGNDVPVALAISLHTADEDERSKLMPVNKKYSLAVLKEALLKYPVQTRHGITFEYVLIKGVNDSVTHAKKLVRFLHGLKAKVNLIPMNEHPGIAMERSDDSHIREFQSYLTARSIPAPVRYSRGQDVSGACGQLASKRETETKLPPRAVALARQREYLAAKRPQQPQQ